MTVRKLANRPILAMVGAAVLVAAVTLVASAQLLLDHVHGSFLEQQSTLHRAVSTGIEHAVAHDRSADIEKALAALEPLSTFAGAVVYDAERAPLHTTPQGFSPPALARQQLLEGGRITHGDIVFTVGPLLRTLEPDRDQRLDLNLNLDPASDPEPDSGSEQGAESEVAAETPEVPLVQARESTAEAEEEPGQSTDHEDVEVVGYLLLGMTQESLHARQGQTLFLLLAVALPLLIALIYLISRQIARAQRTMQEAVEAEGASNQAKTDFVANMSHEMRTPMNAIIGHADLLLDGGTTSEQRQDSLDSIRRNSKHLLALISDVLDLSKLEAGGMDVELLPCSPIEVLADVESILRNRAEQRGLSFLIENTTPIPSLVVTDPTRLLQILLNLVGNAIKFTKRGEVRIIVSCVDTDTADPSMRFAVADTGVGMSEQQLTAIFEPFRQADTSTTRKYGGTGLGLTISRRFARLLGGELTVSSQQGVGSVFSFAITTGPLSGPMVEELGARPAPAPRPAPGGSERGAGAGTAPGPGWQ